MYKGKFKVGDKVVVNNKLLDMKWKHLNFMIGKTYTISNLVGNSIRWQIDDNVIYYDAVHLNNGGLYWFPDDCLDLLRKENDVAKGKTRWYNKGKLEEDWD